MWTNRSMRGRAGEKRMPTGSVVGKARGGSRAFPVGCSARRGGGFVRFPARGGNYVRFPARGGNLVHFWGRFAHGIATSARLSHQIATSRREAGEVGEAGETGETGEACEAGEAGVGTRTAPARWSNVPVGSQGGAAFGWGLPDGEELAVVRCGLSRHLTADDAAESGNSHPTPSARSR